MAEKTLDELPFPEEKKQWIKDKLDPVLEEMVADVITDLPDDPQLFMCQWIQKKLGKTGASRMGLKLEVESMKEELAKIRMTAGEAMLGVEATAADHVESEEEDDEEPPEDFFKPRPAAGARQSVSAEAYGMWNTKKEFAAPVYEKADDQKERLKSVFSKSFMFQALDTASMEVVVKAMQEVRFEAGGSIIKEGDDGDKAAHLFVLEAGNVAVKKNVPAEVEGSEPGTKTVGNLGAGAVFGELALLYNCPRAATIEATEPCVCWQLDRETFNHIVKDAAVKQREKYDNFLKQVHLLDSMDAYERSQIADALKPQSFSKDAVVINQGDNGNTFYILEVGSMIAKKTGDSGETKTVMEYKPGDYFGELALLKNQPRAATVIATSDSQVLSLDRRSFIKMLGPLSDILPKRYE